MIPPITESGGRHDPTAASWQQAEPISVGFYVILSIKTTEKNIVSLRPTRYSVFCISCMTYQMSPYRLFQENLSFRVPPFRMVYLIIQNRHRRIPSILKFFVFFSYSISKLQICKSKHNCFCTYVIYTL